MNIFADIAKGFKWLGKALNTAVVWVPKIVKITEDVGEDAEQLMPQATQVLIDVDTIALAAVKDGGEALTLAAALTGAVDYSRRKQGSQHRDDEAVVYGVRGVHSGNHHEKSNWSDVLMAQQKLVTDWDTFGATAEAALKKLDADATGN